jgi:integrase
MLLTCLPGTSVFIIPEDGVKNGEKFLLVLNRVAVSIIEDVRGGYHEYIFTEHGHPVTAKNNSGWQSALMRAGLSLVCVHDLKHAFGRRLRAAGVSYEDRQDLLGPKSGRITTPYSAAELENLIEATIRVRGETPAKVPHRYR